MQNRKTLSTLVAAILTLSIILAATPMARAMLALTLTPNQGYVGTKVTVSGTSTTPGGLIQVYWDSVKAWDGTAGFLAEGYAVGNSYTITIIVPEAIAGTHYVIVKDVEAAEVSSATFTVIPSAILSPAKVLAGDTVNVTGKGFSKVANAIVLYTPITATNDTLTGTWTGSGGSGALARTPVRPHSGSYYVNITFTNTTKTLYILDNGAGGWSLGTGSSSGYTVSGTIDYVTGAVVISISPALTGTVNRIVSYEYYSTTVKSSTATSDLGSFQTSFMVPVTETAGSKTIISLDGKGNTNSTTLNVVSSIITLTPSIGYRGSTVTVAGRGFTYGKKVDIRWYLTASDYVTVVDDYPVGAGGTFSTTFVVPTVGDPSPPGASYTVKAYEDDTFKADANFTVVAPAKITLSPTVGKVGTVVSVTGVWFSPNSRITLKFGDITLSTTPSLILTGSTGSFSATFLVPNVAAGDYTVTATDAMGVSATATFKVTVPITEIRTRSTTYTQGDQVSIYVKSTESIVNIKLVIKDPTGLTFWQHTITSAEVVTDTITGFNYLNSTVLPPRLPDDATVGSWNFTAYDPTGKKIASNLFTVNAKTAAVTSEELSEAISQMTEQLNQAITQMTEQLNQAITQMTNQITSMQNTISGLSSAINTASSAAQSAASAAQNAASAAQNAASAASAAKTAADSAKTAADSAVSTAQSAVSAADAAKSAADTAASTAESAVSAAESAKAAAEGLAMPVWVAVVLSLISAIAAIFAIITIRGKIAG